MKSEPNGRGIFPEAHIKKDQRLPQYNCKNRHIHWVSDEAVQPFNHQVAGRRDRGRGSFAFPDEAGKGFEQNRSAAYHQQPSRGLQDY